MQEHHSVGSKVHKKRYNLIEYVFWGILDDPAYAYFSGQLPEHNIIFFSRKHYLLRIKNQPGNSSADLPMKQPPCSMLIPKI